MPGNILQDKIVNYLQEHVRNHNGLPFWSLGMGIEGIFDEFSRTKYLAVKHKGMRVDHSGILGRIANGCKVRPDQRFILGKMDKHLEEMAARFYAGDISAVDEFLQLYCLDENRPGDAA